MHPVKSGLLLFSNVGINCGFPCCRRFWFIFLAVTSGIVILYRAIVTFSPTIRKWRLRSISKSIDEDDLERVISKADFGDWFFLYELGRNMNPIYFAELIKELSGSIGKDGSYKDQLLPY